MSDAIPLRQWRPGAKSEPGVCIGVILAEGATTATELHVPDAPYLLERDGPPPRNISNPRLPVRLGDDGRNVSVAINDEPPQSAASWTLSPRDARPLQRGGGVLVRDVVAGRGFHWQKHVDQTLPARVDIVA